MCVQANFTDIYLRGMRDRSMRSGTELARKIQLTDWSTAGEQGKLVLVVSTTPSLAQFISFFTTGKKSSFDRLNYRSIQVFLFKISVKKKRRKEIPMDKQNFFRSLNQIGHFFIWKLVFIHMQMKTNFHMKRWAPGLALKKRPKVIRKWPIAIPGFFADEKLLKKPWEPGCAPQISHCTASISSVTSVGGVFCCPENVDCEEKGP